MPTLSEVRQKYPQYDDIPDQELADKLHSKFYADMPKEEFYSKIGMPTESPMEAAKGSEQSGVREGIRAFTGAALEGIPIAGPYIRSGAEKAAALKRSVMQGKPYDQALSEIESEMGRIEKERPVTTAAGNVTGAVAGLAPLGATGLGARALGITGPSMAARMGAGAASGGAIGGTDAAVRSGGDPVATAIGAGAGGVMGGVAAPIGRAVGAGVRGVANAVSGRTPAASARRILAEGMERDQLTPQAARTRLDEMGPDAMVADLGPNLTGQTAALASLPGQGQRIIRDAIAARTARAGPRVGQAVEGALGPRRDVPAIAEGVIRDRAAAAQPLYDAAYARPMPRSREIQQVLDSPAGRLAWARAQRLAANERNPINLEEPSVRALDLTKRSLDDMIDAARRRGNNNEARVITGLRNDLVRAVDREVPEYAAARHEYAGYSALSDALEQGQDVFSRATAPDDLRAVLARMTAGERDAFQIGARSQIDQIMGSARNDALSARSLFEKGWNEEKLGLVVGPQRAERLMRSLDTERAFQNTAHRVTQNSETAARLAAQAELGAAGGPGLIKQGLVAGGVMGAIRGAGVRQMERGLEALSGSSRQRVREELARLQTATGPEARAVLERLNADLTRTNRPAEAAEVIMRHLVFNSPAAQRGSLTPQSPQSAARP